MASRYPPNQLPALQAAAGDSREADLLAATLWLRGLLQAHNIAYSIKGGFGLRIRGSDRRTQDIDVDVNANMGTLKPILQEQTPLSIPAGPVADVMRVFWKVPNTTTNRYVEMDLFPLGFMNDAFGENEPPKVQAVPYGENGSQVNLQVLSLKPQIVSKLRAFAARQSQNDYTDLFWLTNKYPQEIRDFSGELNYEQRKAFCTRFAQNNANQEARVRRVKHVLKVI